MKNPLFSFLIMPSSGSLSIFKHQFLAFKKNNLKVKPCTLLSLHSANALETTKPTLSVWATHYKAYTQPSSGLETVRAKLSGF